MEPKFKAELLDAILRKFEGNKTFKWHEMHVEGWYKPLHSEWPYVENMINKLISEDYLYRNKDLLDNWNDKYSLTSKGFATLGDDNESFLSIYKEKAEQKQYAKDAMHYAEWAMYASFAGIAIMLIIEVIKYYIDKS